MPDISLPPLNQCLADGSSEAAETSDTASGGAATAAVQPSAAFGGTDGAEGGDTSGSEALVRRFSGDGAGGAPGTSGALSPSPDPCRKDRTRAVVTCGGSVVAGLGTAGLGGMVGALHCAQAILSLDECLEEHGVSGR